MTKKKATALAQRVLKEMRGRGWKSRVWENADQWYAAVYNGPLQIYFDQAAFDATDRGFSTLIGEEDGETGGIPTFRLDADFDDPNEAAMAQMRRVDQAMAAIERLRKRLPTEPTNRRARLARSNQP